MTIENEDLQRAVDIVAAVRESVGPNVDLLIECHGRFNPYTAIKISRMLEPYNIYLMEEPCPPDNINAIAHVRKKQTFIFQQEKGYIRYMTLKIFLKKSLLILLNPIFSMQGGF